MQNICYQLFINTALLEARERRKIKYYASEKSHSLTNVAVATTDIFSYFFLISKGCNKFNRTILRMLRQESPTSRKRIMFENASELLYIRDLFKVSFFSLCYISIVVETHGDAPEGAK